MLLSDIFTMIILILLLILHILNEKEIKHLKTQVDDIIYAFKISSEHQHKILS